MLITNKETNISVEQLSQFPMILVLNKHGLPVQWVDYERACYYKAKEKVLWSLGEIELVIRGGTNSITGLQSKLILDSIIAIDYAGNPTKYKNTVPTLTNKTLFARDRQICAYCSVKYKDTELTRDHIMPQSRGGRDEWIGVVTACKNCNHYKADRTPEEADMPLAYVPYVPNYHEYMIMRNRKITGDQMEFLSKGIPKHSRLHLN